jgi:hypothetical protein
MSETDPNLSPLADRLLADVYYHLVHTLRGILPTPPKATPRYLARRDNALIGRLAQLRPANPIEAEIAADFIACTEHANDCLRIAHDPKTSPQWAVKSRAQAKAMKGQAYAALNRLERMQKERRKLENDPGTGETWAEHCVIGLIKDAFAEQDDPDAELLNELEPLDDVDPDTLTPEQQKAVIHRQRAALIRRTKQTLDDPSFKDTVAKLVAGTSLDEELRRQNARPPPGASPR